MYLKFNNEDIEVFNEKPEDIVKEGNRWYPPWILAISTEERRYWISAKIVYKYFKDKEKIEELVYGNHVIYK